MKNNKLSDVNSKGGSELIAIAHGIAAKFESPATELLRELASRLECSIVRGDELQQKLDALAAENAALKSVIDAVRGVADQSKGIAGWHLNGDIARWDEILPEIDDIEAPATDTYLNSVRAEGVKILADRMQQTIDNAKLNSDEIGALAGAIFTGAAIAAQLRSGTHDTADKAG